MKRPAALALATLATTGTMLVLDLTWLGLIARGLYDAQLGSLKRPEAYLPAALIFYALYVAVTVGYGVLGENGVAAAAKRGAMLGAVAYGTYELTNWAVLRDWPALLVPIDLAWGVVLTATAAAVGRAVLGRVDGSAGATTATKSGQ